MRGCWENCIWTSPQCSSFVIWRRMLQHACVPLQQTIMLAEATAQRSIKLMQQAKSPQLAGQRSTEQQAQPAGSSMLPLRELKLQGAVHGTLLPTISACCRHLTKLQLQHQANCTPKDVSTRDYSPLRFLRELRELSIACDGDWKAAAGSLSCVSSMTHLNKLELPALEQDLVKHLPVSSKDLSIMSPASAPDLQGLSSLTRLQAGSVDPQLLPAQLQELHLGCLEWQDGLLQLQQLQSLRIDVHDWKKVPDLASLTALTQLTAFRVTINMMQYSSPVLSALSEQLPKLPLVFLQSNNDNITAADVKHLGQCTQLTGLHLVNLHVLPSVAALAEQLQKLERLECLTLDGLWFRPHPQHCSDFEPIVAAILQLCGKCLRSVSLGQLVLDYGRER
jgi:hypothetical protein